MKKIKEKTLFLGTFLLAYLAGRMIYYNIISTNLDIERLHEIMRTDSVLVYASLLFLVISKIISIKIDK